MLGRLDAVEPRYGLARPILEQDPGGSIDAVKRFDFRLAAPGTRFSYSSADTVVLGLVVAAATGRTLADYAREKLWQPLGTEADASWMVDAKGHAVTFAYYNAVLRDYARLGLMLAHHGAWAGRSIVPRRWLAGSIANSVETESALRYGYHVWVSADSRRFMQTSLTHEDFLVNELSAFGRRRGRSCASATSTRTDSWMKSG